MKPIVFSSNFFIFPFNCVCANDPRATAYHEIQRWRQAEEYKKKYGSLGGNYIQNLCAECNRKLDRIGINEYYVSEISKYAEQNFLIERFDEVDAEYEVKHLLSRKGQK